MKNIFIMLFGCLFGIGLIGCEKMEPEPTNPDLRVNAITVSDSTPGAGQSITLSTTVSNSGSVDSSSTTLRWYRSVDSTITSSDTEIGTNTVPSLLSGESQNTNITVSAPTTLGTYYYGACVDAVSDETDTNNNCSSGTMVTVVAPTPDLRLGSASVSDSTPGAGQSITLSTTVSNSGSDDSSSTTLRWYRSVDSTITSSDTEIGTNTVPSLLAGESQNTNITVSAPTTAGTSYYGACVDAVSDETDINNNCSSGTMVTVVTPTPDLRLGSASVSDSTPGAGQSITLSTTVSNSGSDDSSSTTLRWYRSVDSTITSSDTEIGTNTVPSLLAGESQNTNITVSAPTTAGTSYYGACVDAVSDETDINNNCSSGTMVTVVTPTPDLRLGSASVSDSTPVAGQSITLSTTVSNSGSDDSSSTTLRWYRSVDSTITSSDTEIGTNTVPSLLAGESQNTNITVSAPTEVGTYYYGACVDAVSDETDTNNNCSSGTMVVVVYPNDFTTLAAAGNTSPRGIWSDGTTMWVADLNDDKLYAYSLSTKARDESEDFNTLSAAGNNFSTGLWSDGTTMWVSDFTDDKLYAYSLSTKARITNEDFTTLAAEGNTSPQGLWSDGTTMWVVDNTDVKIYAYSLSTKAPITNEDFNTLSAAGNNIPVGLWSDGTTMWVADNTDLKIYAYSLSTKARITNEDFNTLTAAGNTTPVDLWSDGTTMWVADFLDAKIYAYSLATKQRTP